MRPRPDWTPQTRCLICGCPGEDHVAPRYPLRAWVLHLLPARIVRAIKPLRR